MPMSPTMRMTWAPSRARSMAVERVSRTGCRVYRSVEELPSPMSGLGIAIVSTSSGVMSDRECRAKRVGGEVVATVG